MTAASFRGFGPIGIIAMVTVLLLTAAFEPFTAVVVPLWVWASRTPWRELGYIRPRSWMWTIVLGVLGGASFKLLMKAVVMPLLGAPPVNAAYQYLAGNPAALPAMLVTVIVGAGFGEESAYRGFLFERLGRLRVPKEVIIVLGALFFGALHYPGQGLFGAEQATIVGVVFGAIFARTRQLPALMIAHASFDITAVALIYNGWEAPVARFFFG